MMSCNVGTADRIVRLVLAALLLAAAASGSLVDWAAVGAVFVAVVLGLTAILRFCPLYALLRIRTCPAEAR
ncbi:MAG: hypothetical protein KatS3mg065_0389 [Chloroflexota bacterium]|nr:MAG: hypothetical protein KatS3mg065_0389 [Chloroflexota bacterium]